MNQAAAVCLRSLGDIEKRQHGSDIRDAIRQHLARLGSCLRRRFDLLLARLVNRAVFAVHAVRRQIFVLIFQVNFSCY